jgi:hypothetical protein
MTEETRDAPETSHDGPCARDRASGSRFLASGRPCCTTAAAPCRARTAYGVPPEGVAHYR